MAPIKKNLRKDSPIRYAVVGLGYFAQIAVLPGFSHAKNSHLAALVSGDPVKLRRLARKYRAPKTYSYEEFDKCLDSGEIDAVYIALTNDLHKEYAVRAALKGIHVLCEKPMAVTEKECEMMIQAASKGRARMMIAYRLHLEEANLKAIETVRSGKIGEARIFNSLFTQQVRSGNFRLKAEQGGGSLYDVGIYCVNAARYLFQAEPSEVVAFSASSEDARFKEIDEMSSAILRFPGDRLAAFTCSFGSADRSAYEIVGTKGSLRVEDAYKFAAGAKHLLIQDGKKRQRTFAKKDQIGAEIAYFSNCVLKGKNPEPSGKEGLADVRIIRALYASARTGKPVKLGSFEKKSRPRISQAVRRPPVDKPDLFHAKPVTR
jgi:glucose-fructose oxidoreductase